MRGRKLRSEPISWHMPMNFSSGNARWTVVQMRLIGLLKLKTVASGQIRITSAQISRIGGMMRSEWNSPPGPPFSP